MGCRGGTLMFILTNMKDCFKKCIFRKHVNFPQLMVINCVLMVHTKQYAMYNYDFIMKEIVKVITQQGELVQLSKESTSILGDGAYIIYRIDESIILELYFRY